MVGIGPLAYHATRSEFDGHCTRLVSTPEGAPEGESTHASRRMPRQQCYVLQQS